MLNSAGERTPPCGASVSAFMICRGLCACTEMLCSVCEFWV